MTELNPRKLPSRLYAHPFDRRVLRENKSYGVGRGNEYIGGYSGTGWETAFKCHLTDEIYTVSVSDGVNGGKSEFSDDTLRWMSEMSKRIIARTKAATRGPVRISLQEWRLMLHEGLINWMDWNNENTDSTGCPNRHLDEGVVGTINGLNVLVDPSMSNPLPPIGEYQSDPLDDLLFRRKSTSDHSTSAFSGIFADAFAKARHHAS